MAEGSAEGRGIALYAPPAREDLNGTRRARRTDSHVELRPGDIVPRDIPSYETMFWQNIISGKRRLSAVQVIGIGIPSGAVAFVLWSMIKGMISSPIIGLLFVSACGALFLLLRWRVRKALK